MFWDAPGPIVTLPANVPAGVVIDVAAVITVEHGFVIVATQVNDVFGHTEVPLFAPVWPN
jgi:hypothetical protein